MKRNKVKQISVVMAALLMTGAASGCGTKNEAAAANAEGLPHENTPNAQETTEESAPSNNAGVEANQIYQNEAKPSGTTPKENKAKPGNQANDSKHQANAGNSGNASKGSSSPKPNQNRNGSKAKPIHTHKWVDATKTIDHPEKSHMEDVYETRRVKVEDAQDEQVFVKTVQTCNQCGFSTLNPAEMDMHMLKNVHSSSSKEIYNTVHHSAKYKDEKDKVGSKKVVDQKAWKETIVVGQKCATCGASK